MDQVFRLKDGEVIFSRDEDDIIVAVYVNRKDGSEVVSWTEDEWGDRLALSATLNTVAVAMVDGVSAVDR